MSHGPGGLQSGRKNSTLAPVNADRWGRIEDCYHAAMERPVPERAAFIAQACAGDPELRREVESLLAHEGQADPLLEIAAPNDSCSCSHRNTARG